MIQKKSKVLQRASVEQNADGLRHMCAVKGAQPRSRSGGGFGREGGLSTVSPPPSPPPRPTPSFPTVPVTHTVRTKQILNRQREVAGCILAILSFRKTPQALAGSHLCRRKIERRSRSPGASYVLYILNNCVVARGVGMLFPLLNVQ